jgi:DNA-binding MarR family transcriptional regulator
MPETALDPLAVEAQLRLAVSAASRAIVAFYRPLLEPLGLTHPQYMAMLALWQHGDLSLKDLADLLHLEPPTTSPIVKRLETMGLVTRRRSAADERVLAIGLTERGRAMREDAVGIPDAMVDGLGLSLDDLRRIRDAVDTLIEATGRAGAARAPREA